METPSPESAADVGTTKETDDLDTQNPSQQQPDIETTTEIDDPNSEDPPHQKADPNSIYSSLLQVLVERTSFLDPQETLVSIMFRYEPIPYIEGLSHLYQSSGSVNKSSLAPSCYSIRLEACRRHGLILFCQSNIETYADH
jgi:hypothetical protein